MRYKRKYRDFKDLTAITVSTHPTKDKIEVQISKYDLEMLTDGHNYKFHYDESGYTAYFPNIKIIWEHFSANVDEPIIYHGTFSVATMDLVKT